jgi:Ca2+-binding EF-hand superfamily protein
LGTSDEERSNLPNERRRARHRFDVANAVFDSGDHLFNQIDDNKSGDFDMENLNDIFVINGIYLEEEELKQVYTDIDNEGGEGTVQKEELLARPDGGHCRLPSPYPRV